MLDKDLIDLKHQFKKLCIASDHAGFNIKEFIKNFLEK